MSDLEGKVLVVEQEFPEDGTAPVEDLVDCVLVSNIGDLSDSSASSRTSRASRSSVSSANNSSRNNSPKTEENLRQNGYEALVQTLAKIGQVALNPKITKKEQKAAYKDLMDVAQDDRVRLALDGERERNERKSAQQLAATLRHVVGDSPAINLTRYAFKTLEETTTESERLESLIKRDLKHEFKRMNSACINMKFLIDFIIEKYNGKLSALQVKSIIVGLCDDSFKEVIAEVFNRNTLGQALTEVVRLYALQQTSVDLIHNFHTMKIDAKHIKTSLNELYHAGVQAYPQLNNDALHAILRTQALANISDPLLFKLLDFQGKIEELRRVNPLIPPMEWATFVEKATELANND
jgi:hypothetical protein